MGEIAVGRDHWRIEFAADRRDQCVVRLERRSTGADFRGDFAGCDCRSFVDTVDLAPFEIPASASNRPVRTPRNRLGTTTIRAFRASRTLDFVCEQDARLRL